MADLSIRVTRFHNGFKDLRTRIVQETDIRAKATADDVVETAKRIAPRDTGYLADTIHAEQKSSHPAVFEVSSEADYAPMVEWGTRYQNAQPFLRPALEEARGRMEARYQGMFG